MQKGLQISRSTIRWFDHNDLKSLEEVLVSVEKERKKKEKEMAKEMEKYEDERIYEREIIYDGPPRKGRYYR